MSSLSVQFLGGAGTVTGSKFLVQWKTRGSTRRILIDCGMFQGIKEHRLRNRERFAVDPSSIQQLILTHAHLDHTGHLPLLVKQGYRGPVFCSNPTRDLARLILEDSAKLQEEDAAYANRLGFSKHAPALPLYTVADAHKAMKLFRPVSCGEWHDLGGNARFRLVMSGHILGSTFVDLIADGARLVFSGDLGRAQPRVLHPPIPLSEADYLFIESTYGDRNHVSSDTMGDLARVTKETVARKGHLLVPSFAVGRTQELLHFFANLRKSRRIPEVPIYLDSPLGINATEIFASYPDWHLLSRQEVDDLYRFVIPVKSPQQSRELLAKRKSSIVIAGSGMLAGGRILHHLTARLDNDRNTILLPGFQAAGTRGRQLQDGATELKIFGQYFAVKAKVETMSGLSAHADQREILDWLSGFRKPPKKTFIIHGEPQASDSLRVRIHDRFGWSCAIPSHSEVEKLDA